MENKSIEALLEQFGKMQASYLRQNPMSWKLSLKQFHYSLLELFLEYMYSSSPQMQNKYVTTVEKTSSMHKF